MVKLKTLYYFNPTCEMAVANGSPYYQPPLLLREFEESLSTILLCYANESDFLLREPPISTQLKENFQQLGCGEPTVGNKYEILTLLKKDKDKIQLSPWGWSPSAYNELKEFLPFCSHPIPQEAQTLKNYHERKNAVSLIESLVENEHPDFILQQPFLPKLVHTLKDVEEAIQAWGKVIFKAPLSSSGRGLLVIRKSNLNHSNIQWIKTILKQQDYLVAEPLLDKRIDFSFQYQVLPKEQIEFLGITFFETNSNGQYQGHYINSTPDHFSILNQEFPENYLTQLAQRIKTELSKSPYAIQEGFLGVDALFYKEDNWYKIHPCVEVNARNNMGILSIKLKRLIHPQSFGYYRIYNDRKTNYADFAKKMKLETPPKFKNGKFHKGFLSLTEPKSNQQFGAYLILYGDE